MTRYKAVYDYTARQDDEISFNKGDIISHPCFCARDGWMIGRVERTGMQGLFPLTCIQRLI